MRTGKEAKEDLLAALAAVGDGRLAGHGFKRAARSFIYRRMLGDARQAIDFVVDCWPRHRPGEELFLGPLVQVRMPVVTKAALKLAGGDARLFANAPEVILNQPLKMTAPKSEDVYWYATGLGQMEERVGEIVDFIERWVLPFLQVLRMPEDLVEVHRSTDERVLRERHWYLFVAAAERLRGHPREALAVLEEAFRAPALRTRYAAAFAALRRDLEEGGN